MAKDLFSRYIWLVDTIRRYGSITRAEINRLWAASPYGDGAELPRRTFYAYRQAVEELFKINIAVNPSTNEYYIEDDSASPSDTTMNWLLNSASIGSLLTDAHTVGHRIILEEVPSAREHLTIAVDAIKDNRQLTFTYHQYSRVNPKSGIVLEPYFLKIFKQRWYVTGRNVREGGVMRTYALDRMTDVRLLSTTFVLPADFDPQTYFRDSYGIVFDEGLVKHVVIRTDPRQAKYFRSVPLHHSQRESIHDNFSTFHYQIKLTPDFVQELLSHGPNITVLEPPELRAAIIHSLRTSLAAYE